MGRNDTAYAVGPFSVEEAVHGETKWVAIRARGAEWSWLTPEEALAIGRAWVEKYGAREEPPLHLVETFPRRAVNE